MPFTACVLCGKASHTLFPLLLWQDKNHFPHCLDKKLRLEKINDLSGNIYPVMGGAGIKS